MCVCSGRVNSMASIMHYSEFTPGWPLFKCQETTQPILQYSVFRSMGSVVTLTTFISDVLFLEQSY